MFDRNETLKLAGVSSNQLQSLVKEEIIKPHKIDEFVNAKSFFSYSQIIEIRAIQELKKQAQNSKSRITFKMIKEAMKTLSDMGLEESLADRNGFVFCFDNGAITLKSTLEALKMSISGNSKYQMFLLIDDIKEQVHNAAIKNNIVRFEEKKIKSREVSLVA
jgi:DNA-binding transcriptional MerR regulator